MAKRSVYQRKDGRWVAPLELERNGDNRKRKSFYGDNKAESTTMLSQRVHANLV